MTLARKSPRPRPRTPTVFLDVYGDNAITAIDVLATINYINGHTTGQGEGEASGSTTMPTNVWEPGARLSSGPEHSNARKQAGYSDAVRPSFVISVTVAVPGKSL